MGSDTPPTVEYELALRGGGAAQAADVIAERLEGVGGASAREDGTRRVLVELPRNRATALLPLVAARGRLELYDLQGSLVPPSIDAQGFPVAISDRDEVYAHGLPEDVVIVRCGAEQPACPGADEPQPTRTYYYALRGPPDLTGAHFDRDATRQDFDNATDEPIVFLELTEAGALAFRELTRELAMRGRLAAAGRVGDALAFQQVAIVVDGTLVSVPTIDFREFPDGIPAEAGLQIGGLGSLEEARTLAAIIRSGELPERPIVTRGSEREMEN